MYNRVAAANQMPEQVSALKVDLEELFSQSLRWGENDACRPQCLIDKFGVGLIDSEWL